MSSRKAVTAILSYQDFQKAQDKPAFILEAIAQHKSSYEYRRAVTAQSYYSTDNEQIMTKMTYLQRQFPGLRDIKFHKITDSFFQNGVNEHVLYLLGNGLTVNKEGKFTKETKKTIDPELDFKLIQGAIIAFVDSVAWCYPRINGEARRGAAVTRKKQGELFFFRVTEFKPLYDELTGQLMAGIRFTQIASDKPKVIELFEIDGLTKYTQKDSDSLEIATPKTPYRVTATSYGTGDIISGVENYPVLPIFPLYANMQHKTELSTSVQALIDAVDFITSAQTDSTTLVEGVYWILQNFGGQDLREVMDDIMREKAILPFADEGTPGATPHVLESPYQGKESLRNELNAKLYSTFRLPDPNQARAVTATEIKALNAPMDRKADLFEPLVRQFMAQILQLYGIDEEMPDFKRRTLQNDTEAVNNISVQIASGYIDEEEAIFLDPTIPEDRKADLLLRIQERGSGIPPGDESLDDEPPEV